MSEQYDLIVVGAGVAGLGSAWAAQRLGARVLVLESGPRPEGASVRNFGMLWPIGQPEGPRREAALRGLELWSRLAELSSTSSVPVRVRPCGSLTVAHHDDSWAVLQEFHSGQRDDAFELLSAQEAARRSPAVQPDGLRGGLFSSRECGVEPRQAVAAFAAWLPTQGVDVWFGKPVVRAEDERVHTADGAVLRSRKTIVCSGAQFATLFPREHASCGARLCKLQMLRCGPQPRGFDVGPHLASDLTLRHYPSFAGCPSLDRVIERIERDSPELNRYGIHVMASQGMDGQVILGDSHVYDDEVTPFDCGEIERLMLRELRKSYQLPNWDVVERWHGVYFKHPERHFVELDPRPGVKILNGLGGNGMTLGLAVSEEVTQRWLQG